MTKRSTSLGAVALTTMSHTLIAVRTTGKINQTTRRGFGCSSSEVLTSNYINMGHDYCNLQCVDKTVLSTELYDSSS